MAATSAYLVGETIGEGSFGQVVHARHKESGLDVAVKVIEKVVIKKNPHLMKSIWKERSILQQLRECHFVVNLWASFDDSECCYLVMECSMGGDLGSLIQRAMAVESSSSILSWKESIRHYGLQLVEAMKYIHSQGIIHCDLKPQNCLCDLDGKLKLADFGSAIQKQGVHCCPSILSNTPIHESLKTPYTVDYACPEILKGASPEKLTMAVDAWSLGCTIFAMWHGHSPFHSQSDALAVQMVFGYCNEYPNQEIPQQELRLPQEWKDLISSLLHPNPSHRLGSTLRSEIELVELDIWPNVGLNKKPSFLPEKQAWLSSDTLMRDGSNGWPVFLV